jgi:hypothetical protein
MPVAPEVNAFESEVGCDQDLVGGRHLQYSAIVSNSGQDGRRRASSANLGVRPPALTGGCCHSPDFSNQRFFGDRHGEGIIAEGG